jgi:hypothetical protein
MPDWSYCGKEPPVDAAGTRALLVRHRAIWAPPQALHAQAPAAGDRLWLLWSHRQGARLLGGGRVEATTEGGVFWTNRMLPGVVETARELGYGGPTNMRFLRVIEVHLADLSADAQVDRVPIGLSRVTGPLAQQLAQILPI